MSYTIAPNIEMKLREVSPYRFSSSSTPLMIEDSYNGNLLTPIEASFSLSKRTA